MRRSTVVGGVIVIALLTTAGSCGGDTPGATETVTAQPVPTTVPTTIYTPFTPPPTPPTTPEVPKTPSPSGKKPVPAPKCLRDDGTRPPLHQTVPPRAARSRTQQQACNFAGMWILQAGPDKAIRPIQTLYNQGLVICDRARNRSRTEQLTSLINNGYSDSVAGALYAAATTTLCPTRDPGFRTRLDIAADKMKTEIGTKHLNWANGLPQERWLYSQFGVTICDQLNTFGTQGLSTFLDQGQSWLRLFTIDPVPAGYEKQIYGYYTLAAAQSFCPSTIQAVKSFFEME